MKFLSLRWLHFLAQLRKVFMYKSLVVIKGFGIIWRKSALWVLTVTEVLGESHRLFLSSSLMSLFPWKGWSKKVCDASVNCPRHCIDSLEGKRKAGFQQPFVTILGLYFYSHQLQHVPAASWSVGPRLIYNSSLRWAFSRYESTKGVPFSLSLSHNYGDVSSDIAPSPISLTHFLWLSGKLQENHNRIK